MDLGLKRVLLVILSLAGGVGGVFGIFALLNLAYNARVSFERYGATYFILTAVPLALLIGVWLDYFMGTGLLPSGSREE
jgi:hypothetical protein